MRPVSPVIPDRETPEAVYAEKQPEYNPLPALRTATGTVLSRWLFDEDERKQIAEQGFIYLSVQTFNHPLQPLLLSADPPAEFAKIGQPVNDEWAEEIEG